MKIVFDRKLLCEVFPPLMCAVSNKSTIPAIEGVLIEAVSGGNCLLTTYDTDKGIRTSVEAKIYEPGSYIINAQKFYQIVRVMKGDEIELTVDDRLSAKFVSGKATHRMSALNGFDFPALPEISHDKGFVIGQSVLKKMLSKISHAMAVDDTRQILNGCFFRVENDRLTLVSCDTINLAKCSRKADIKNSGAESSVLDFSFIVPVRTVNELLKLLSDDEEETVEIYMTRKNIVFILGDVTFFSRLIDGEYLDYNRVILKNHKIKVTVDREALLSALDHAALVTEERLAGSVPAHVKLEFDGDLLKVMANSSGGSIYDEVAIGHQGDNLLIGFNNKYLINGIKACSGEKVVMSLSSPLTSMNVEPVDNNDESEELFMFLPVKMKE